MGISSARPPSTTAVPAQSSATASAAGTDAEKFPDIGLGVPVFPPPRIPGGASPAAGTALTDDGRSSAAARAPATNAPAARAPAAAPEAQPPDLTDPLLKDARAGLLQSAAVPAAVEDAAPAGQPASPGSAPRARPKQPISARTTNDAAPAALLAQAPALLVTTPSEGSPAPGPATNADSAAPDASAPLRAALASAQRTAATPTLPITTPAAGLPDDGDPQGDTASPSPASPGAGTGSTFAAASKATTGTTLSAAAAPQAAAVPQQRSDDATSDGSDNAQDPSVLAGELAAAHATGANTDAGQVAPAVPATTVHTPVGSSGWAEEMSAHVIWMAHQGVTSASLRLQPEHLGPVEVRISMRDDSASVWFSATQPETRAALEQALPQLRDMFAAQGMTLSDASVSQQSPREPQHAQPTARTPGSAASETATSVSVPLRRRGLIDTYA